MMQHKGYVGVARIDEEAGVLRGRVVNTRDLITFQGATVAELEQAFRESIEDYLEFCAERGEAPEKPFSGNFLVRTTPEIHRALMLKAEQRGESLNQFVGRVLADAAGYQAVSEVVKARGPAKGGGSGKAIKKRSGKSTKDAKSRTRATTSAKA